MEERAARVSKGQGFYSMIGVEINQISYLCRRWRPKQNIALFILRQS